jgi:hypothetical protein
MKKILSALLFLLAAVFFLGCNGKKNGGANGKNGGTTRHGVTPAAFTFQTPPLEKDAPRLTAEEIAALFKIARLNPLKIQKLSVKDLRQMLKLPERMFAEHRGYVLVNLYRPGSRELITGYSLGGNLAFSVAGATRVALGSRDPKLLQNCAIRIDLIYDLKPMDPRDRKETMIPGLEGLACLNKGAVVFMPADRFLGDKPDVVQYILGLEQLAGLPSGTWKNGKMLLGKYRSRALLQLKKGDDPVALYRSNVLAAPPDAEQCRQAAARGMDWLKRIQKADGSFPYYYYPYADRYDTTKYNIVRHAGTAFSLFSAARQRISGGKPALATADPYFVVGEKALDFIKKTAVRDPRFGFTYVPDGKRIKLGAAALALVAFCERERAGGDASNRDIMTGLARFILNQQTPQGEFISHYDAAKGRPVKKFISLYYPGEALLGLLRLYKLTGRKDQQLLAACHRGAAYLIKFEKAQAADHQNKGGKLSQSYPPDAWFMQALEEIIDVDSKPEYVRHLFILADSMIAWQFVAVGDADAKTPALGEVTRYHDLLGAIDESDPPSACATGGRCEGLVAALRVARKLGKKDAAALYEKSLRLAAKYVVQNQYHAHNAYALPTPSKAIGAFRLNPLECSIRIDYVQHCSSFLMEWAKLQESAPKP